MSNVTMNSRTETKKYGEIKKTLLFLLVINEYSLI